MRNHTETHISNTCVVPGFVQFVERKDACLSVYAYLFPKSEIFGLRFYNTAIFCMCGTLLSR